MPDKCLKDPLLGVNFKDIYTPFEVQPVQEWAHPLISLH